MSPTFIKSKSYISIARPDHWTKHIFILPGVLGSLTLAPLNLTAFQICFNFFFGIFSACLMASANYVINEWMDAESDRNHPEKSSRAAAVGILNPHWVYCEYFALVICAFGLAYCVNTIFLIVTLIFFISGITYNLRPFRTKEIIYLDVISEAINNPIRLAMGWAIVSNTTIPPLSLIFAYWTGGMFLMAAKRLSEYQFIVSKRGPEGPGLYRRSFIFYTNSSLTLSCFIYALCSIFFIGVFFVKYRTELILSFPFIVTLFAYYFYLAMKPISLAQKPELLFKDFRLIALVFLLSVSIIFLSSVDIAFVKHIFESRFIDFRFD
jgi:decaprenyl-phosphate phosphoribosyltransferase